MSNRKSILKNFSLLLTAEVIGHILSFLLIIMISRYLGDSRLGIYSFAFAFTAIFGIIFELGFSVLLMKEVAKDKGKTERYFNNIFTLRFLLGILGILIPGVIMLFIGKVGYDIRVVWLAGIALFFNYLGYTLKSLFQAYEAVQYEAVARIIEKTVAFGIGTTALLNGYGLVAVVSGMVVSNMIYFLILFVSAKRRITDIHLSFDFVFWKYLIAKSLPFWFVLLFVNIYFKVDTVMLTLMKDYAVTGWYNAAHKLLTGLHFIPISFAYVMLPVMSRISKQSRKLLKLTYRKAFYYMLSLAIPIGAGTTILADKIIVALYTGKFFHSVIALQILIWAVVFLFINHVVGNFLYAIDKDYMWSFSAGISLLLNVILNFILIPTFSYIGASLSTVITEALCFILLLYFSSKSGYWLNVPKLCWKPTIATVVMVSVLLFLRHMSLIILVPIGVIVYIVIMFIIKGIDKDEIDFIKTLIVRQK